MTLKDYLKKNDLTLQRFADRLGRHKSVIATASNGRFITMDLAIQISAATKNEVTVNELFQTVKDRGYERKPAYGFSL